MRCARPDRQIFAAGAAIISIIIFSSTAANAGTFTDFASFAGRGQRA